MKKSVSDILDLNERLDIVDIGANPIDGEPPYKKLLDEKLVNLIGFEPNEDALMRLNKMKSVNETYIGKAVYDGTKQELKLCRAEGMTSLLEPNASLLEYLHGFSEWGLVENRQQIQTVKLDDVREIKNIDYLKIDIQGAELEVFKNATNFLSNCLVIHTEVEFLPMYENQPLFSEVEMYLRELGFIFHRFSPLVSRVVKPMFINNNPYAELSQVTWADAIFVKDFTQFNKLSILQLKKIALIMHDIYGSFDIVLRALMEVDKKSSKEHYSRMYIELLSQ
jgi:FkbM family methyltransferase